MKFILHPSPFTAHLWRQMGHWILWFPGDHTRRVWDGKKWSIEEFEQGEWRTQSDLAILRQKDHEKKFGKYERRS